MSVELSSDLVLHEFYKFVLGARPFSLSCNHLTLRRMLALIFIICLALGIRSVEVHLQEPVHHRVRITADRRSEMCIELESEAIMSDIVSAVAGLCHRTQCEDFDRAELRLVLGLCKESVQCLRKFPSVLRCLHSISEVTGECPESGHFLLVWLIMDTIYESLG